MVGDTESRGASLEKTQRAARLNEAFREGREAWEVLDDLRALEKPILVDFNNVLASNAIPFIPNPQGKPFLDVLRSVGDIVIATTARNWDLVHQHLVENGMWNDEIILMTPHNWGFLGSSDQAIGESKVAKENLLVSYRETLKKRGIEVSEDDLDVVATMKPLPPLFNKSFDIPLVDDSGMATLHPFPGILGINTKPFIDEEKEKYRDVSQGVSLPEAAEQVRNYYSSI